MGRPKGGGGDARERLLDAAGRGFREGGFGGIGVDGLAKEAGLTSGAFYAHFDSKADAFRLTVTEGLQRLTNRIEAFQQDLGDEWLDRFVEVYLGERMAVHLSDACALPTFTSDVTRAAAETRDAYTAELSKLCRAVAAGLRGEQREKRAWQLLAILSGAAGMARATTDPALRDAILEAAKSLARTIR